jgi:hypothetical protein
MRTVTPLAIRLGVRFAGDRVTVASSVFEMRVSREPRTKLRSSANHTMTLCETRTCECNNLPKAFHCNRRFKANEAYLEALPAGAGDWERLKHNAYTSEIFAAEVKATPLSPQEFL